MKKLLLVVALMALAAVVVIGGRWYIYVTNEESPYDEIGIDLNNMMPAPINKWGCAQLQSRFGAMLPPYGCQAGSDGRTWR